MSFVVTDSKILIIINNYASYNMRFFRARNSVYKLGKLHYSKFSIFHFFFYYPMSIFFPSILYYY